jgi:hypothetical protein
MSRSNGCRGPLFPPGVVTFWGVVGGA